MSTTPAPVQTSDGNKDLEYWTFELFGCFDEPGLCLFTFLVPCYTAGRNAESLGEDGCVVGILYGLGFAFGIGPLLRWRIRQDKGLRGNMLSDVMVHYFLPCCALIQENKQLYGIKGSHVGEKIPITQEMERK